MYSCRQNRGGVRLNQWLNLITFLVSDPASKTFCCQHDFLMTWGLKEGGKTGWLETRQGDKHRTVFFYSFFLYRHVTQSDLSFPPRRSTVSFSITHILTDSSLRGRLYPDKTKPFSCLPDRIHSRRKTLWERSGGETQTYGGRSLLFMLLLDVFTLQPHAAAVICLTQTVSASYLYWSSLTVGRPSVILTV